ncbi:glucooligosaccharide oxidase-like protein [Halenospora varia]|nr:glucooligosaccharide oxidase-like protein [Halenospora varia]
MYVLLHLYAAFLFGDSLVHASPSPHGKDWARADIVTCIKGKGVPYSIKGSTDFAALIKPANLRLAYTPAVVTIPTTPDQVTASVQCAAAANLKVQAKGGGHSYASYSLGGKDGSMVIDMQKFGTITVDQSTFVAKIGAGQRLGNIATALYSQGKRALPHGTCAGVGIAGHSLHGGYGYSSRKWGLTLDHIVALDVVLANGTQIHTTSTSYPDIFYAMRGAGDSFGVATYFYLSTVAAPTTVQYFTSDLSASLSTASKATTAFRSLQNYVLTNTALTSDYTFGMYIDSDLTYNIQGWCMDCTLTSVKSTLSGLLSGYKTTPKIQTLSWIDALTAISAPDALSQPLGSSYNYHDTFYAKSLTSRNSIPLSTAAMTAYFQYILNKQSPNTGAFFSIINLYGGPNSAINIPSADSSSFSDRDALWVIQNYGYTGNNLPPFANSIKTLVDGLQSAVTSAQPDGNFRGYLNYVDPALNAQTAALQYYGAATYDKLLGIKTRVDPGLLFWNPQAIGISPAL